MDTSLVDAGRAERKGGGDFYPALLSRSDSAYFYSDFRKVLILGKNQRHVKKFIPPATNNIQSQTNIDPFFLTNKDSFFRAVLKTDRSIPISELSRKHFNTPRSHNGQFLCPKTGPEGIILGGRDAGIKEDFIQMPAIHLANFR